MQEAWLGSAIAIDFFKAFCNYSIVAEFPPSKNPDYHIFLLNTLGLLVFTTYLFLLGIGFNLWTYLSDTSTIE